MSLSAGCDFTHKDIDNRKHNPSKIASDWQLRSQIRNLFFFRRRFSRGISLLKLFALFMDSSTISSRLLKKVYPNIF